jgi:hypothetical protein
MDTRKDYSQQRKAGSKTKTYSVDEKCSDACGSVMQILKSGRRRETIVSIKG